MKTAIRPNSYWLASAIESMAYRLGSAESDRALHLTLFSVYKLDEEREQADHWSRAVQRRRRALRRLTEALRLRAEEQ